MASSTKRRLGASPLPCGASLLSSDPYVLYLESRHALHIDRQGYNLEFPSPYAEKFPNMYPTTCTHRVAQLLFPFDRIQEVPQPLVR